jgi:hypothetical protein
MLMFDDTTFTLWSQLIGEGMVGELAGEHLVRYPAQIVGFDEARAAEPDALVLSRETGFNRDYGRNPYVGYDEIGSPAFLFRGPSDGRLQPKARVITLEAPRPLAYDFDDLRDALVVHDEVDGTPLLLLWAPGTATAIGAARIASAEDVGAVGVFRPEIDGRRLAFRARRRRCLRRRRDRQRLGRDRAARARDRSKGAPWRPSRTTTRSGSPGRPSGPRPRSAAPGVREVRRAVVAAVLLAALTLAHAQGVGAPFPAFELRDQHGVLVTRDDLLGRPGCSTSGPPGARRAERSCRCWRAPPPTWPPRAWGSCCSTPASGPRSPPATSRPRASTCAPWSTPTSPSAGWSAPRTPCAASAPAACRRPSSSTPTAWCAPPSSAS